MADFLWPREILMVSSWTEGNLGCVCASNSRELYPCIRSEDDLNILYVNLSVHLVRCIPSRRNDLTVNGGESNRR
uniref:Uncharacterized protein n=1 Tax=Mastacembelus armatus TaxID=205130 RepID=A0A3Q3LZV9_9TELE